MHSGRIFLSVFFLMTPNFQLTAQDRSSSNPLLETLVEEAASILAELDSHSGESSRLVEFLNKLTEWIKDRSRTFNSMVAYEDIARVTKDIEELEKVKPPELKSLFLQTNLSQYAASGDSTLSTGALELRRMQGASDTREREIAQLKSDRQKLLRLREAYTKTEETARIVADKIDQQLGNVPLEILCLYKGQSLPMSWFDLSEGLGRPLQERVNSVNEAIKRFNAEIASADSDLKSFDYARTMFGTVWNDSLPTPGPATIEDLKRKMRSEIEDANRRSIEFRRNAASIRDANARIAAIQRVLGIGKSLADLYGAGTALSKESDKPPEPSPLEPNGIPIGPGSEQTPDPTPQPPLPRPGLR